MVAPENPRGGAAKHMAPLGVSKKRIDKNHAPHHQVFVLQEMDEGLNEAINEAIQHEKNRAQVAAIASHVRAPPWIE